MFSTFKKLKIFSVVYIDKTLARYPLNSFIKMEGLLGGALFSEHQLGRETIKAIDF